MPDSSSSEGDSAARVPLSKAISVVLDVLQDTVGTLAVARHKLEREVPDWIEADQADLLRPAEQAGHVAARLETCADALRNASGETGDADLNF